MTKFDTVIEKSMKAIAERGLTSLVEKNVFRGASAAEVASRAKKAEKKGEEVEDAQDMLDEIEKRGI